MAMSSNPSYNIGVPITKSDTVNFVGPDGRVLCDAIYVGGGGDIVIVGQNGNTFTLIGAIAGTIIPVAAMRVNSGSTSATDLVALYSV
jgi:hypothetical protein